MSAVIDFLASVGENAQLRALSVTNLEAALRQAGIEGEAKTAILMEDWRKLESLLGAQQHICCAIHRPDDDDDGEEEEEDEPEQEDDEDKA